MKKIYCITLVFLGLLVSPDSRAQKVGQDLGLDTTRQSKEFANPSVAGGPRGRFLVFRYERQFNYDFNSRVHHLPGGSDRDGKIEDSNIAEIKGYVPVWNRPHLKAVLGVGYEREEFNFKDHTGYTTDYPYYNNLESKGLKSLSAQLALLRPVNYRNFWVLRIKGMLNGDYTADNTDLQDYLRTTAEALYGWKIDKDFAWGVGAQLGYTYGRKTIAPAILFNKNFNEKWGVESVFPANIIFRYRQSESSFFYAGYNLAGYSYVIKVDKPPFRNAPEFANLETIELRHNEAKFKLRWEHEIYDFIWFSAEGGYRMNIAHDAFLEGSKRATKLIKTDVGSAPFAQLELYLVVPKKMALKR